MSILKEIFAYREMLKNLVSKELRARYKGSFFGFLWTFFNPLLLLIVYSAVFSFVMRVEVENYAMFLFVGLLPWTFFAASLQMGASSIIANANLVKKIYFPRELLPLSVVLSNLVNFVLSLVILIPALLVFGIAVKASIIVYIIILAIQFSLVLGFTLLVSSLNVYFRDLEHILGVALTGWFFLCPIVYPETLVPDNFYNLYYYGNPMTPLVIAYRDIFYNGVFPEWNSLLYVFCYALVILIIGVISFRKLQKSFAEEV